MAYSDTTFANLKTRYGLEVQSAAITSTFLSEISPSAHLFSDIESAKLFPMMSEKAKSEAVIFPIIRELKHANKEISIFSGYTFNIVGVADLTGAPDFMISAKPNIIEPSCPVFCIMESKNKSPDDGFAQCAAEMYAARLFNQQTGEPFDTIYGAVTNAFDWVFMKLEGNTIYVDIERYYLKELPKILGIFQDIINIYVK